MEEIEPVEHAQEDIHEHAHEAKERWVLGVALTAALLAALAAIAVSLSGHHESECLLDQLKASDQWSYYQAKGIKENIAASEARMLTAMGKPAPEAGDVERYRKEKEEIKEQANELTRGAAWHLKVHMPFAYAVTLSQIAIAIAAISVLTKKPPFWYGSIVVGLVAFCYLMHGLLMWRAGAA